MATTQPKSKPPNGSALVPGSFDATFGPLIKSETALEKQQLELNKQSAANTAADRAAIIQQQTGNSQEMAQANQEYEAAVTYANEVMQRQRLITLQRGASLKSFMPIAVAFGLLGTALTGGNIANGLAVMGSGLAGFANGKKQKYDEAFQKWQSSMNEAQKEVQDSAERGMAILKDNQYDLGTKLELLKVDSAGNHHVGSALASNSLPAILRVYEQQKQAALKMKDAIAKTAKSLDPKLLPDTLKNVHPLVVGMNPPPMTQDANGNPVAMSAIEQTVEPAYATWKQKTDLQTAQISQLVQGYLANHPGVSPPNALNIVMGHLSAHGGVPAGTAGVTAAVVDHSAKTVSMSQIQSVAIKFNRSIAEVTQEFKDAGYTVSSTQ